MLEGSSLTIYGQPNCDGTLIAGGRRYFGGMFVDEDGNVISGGTHVPTTDDGQAGIGGFNGDPHNAPITITIHGGNIQATDGVGGAGIGCAGALPSSITIYGGTIEATGGTNSAGIGGDVEAVRPIINIYGGSITATGGQNGAGIGGGFDTNSTASVNQPGTITSTAGLLRQRAANTSMLVVILTNLNATQRVSAAVIIPYTTQSTFTAAILRPADMTITTGMAFAAR